MTALISCSSTGIMAVFLTAALAITVLATSLFGDGLRDALDPTLKGR